MSGVSRSGWSAYSLAALVIVLDQAVKYWIVQILHLQDVPTVPVAGPLHLTWVMNPGVSKSVPPTRTSPASASSLLGSRPVSNAPRSDRQARLPSCRMIHAPSALSRSSKSTVGHAPMA